MKCNERHWRRVAHGQYGAITFRQLVGAGLSRHQVQARERAGVLEPVFRGVYRLGGVPATYEQRVMAVCLATGGVTSHRAAAALWSLRGCEPGVLEVTVARRRATVLADVIGHTSAHLDGQDVTRRGAIPITTPARTLLDLGAVAPAAQVESALEDAVHRNLVTPARLRRMLERTGGSGRGGTAVLRTLLAQRKNGWAATESPLEDEIVRLLRDAGLPEPIRQHPVVLPDGRQVRIDLAYPDERIAIEAQSLRWHGDRESLQRDCDKLNALMRLGWRLLAFTWDDARHRAQELVRAVGELRPQSEVRTR